VFIQVEGIDSLEAFGALSGDSDVTEMAKRMAARTVNRWKSYFRNYADQEGPSSRVLG
jgi:hypothetical protein